MKKNKGFTLVELLVVIMILGILMAIIIPAVTGALSEGGGVKCKKNMKSLFEATHVYASRYGGPNKNMPSDVGKAFWQKLCKKETNVLGIPDDDYAQPLFQCAVRQTSSAEIEYRGPGDKLGNLKMSDPVGCDDEPHKDKDSDSGTVVKRDTSVDILTGADWTTALGKCKD